MSAPADRIPDPMLADGEDEFDQTLRPRKLSEFVGGGQGAAFDLPGRRPRSQRAVRAVLLAGPPRLGQDLAGRHHRPRMDSALRVMSGPAIDRKADMAAILTALEPDDVLFIDEIHRLNRAIEELLYPAMEDGCIDIVIGQGPGAHSLRLDLAPFTLVGATTRTGLLTTPLRDRFGITHRLDHYQPEEIERIVHRSARILGVAIDDGGGREIGRRGYGASGVAGSRPKWVPFGWRCSSARSSTASQTPRR